MLVANTWVTHWIRAHSHSFAQFMSFQKIHSATRYHPFRLNSSNHIHQMWTRWAVLLFHHAALDIKWFKLELTISVQICPLISCGKFQPKNWFCRAAKVRCSENFAGFWWQIFCWSHEIKNYIVHCWISSTVGHLQELDGLPLFDSNVFTVYVGHSIENICKTKRRWSQQTSC